MISGLLSNDNPLGSFGALIDQFGPMLGLLAAVNPEMTKLCLQMAKSMIDEMIRVYDETGQLVFPAVPSMPEPKIVEPIIFERKETDEETANDLFEKLVNHPVFQEAVAESQKRPVEAQTPDVSLDMLNDEQLAAARALYAEAAKDGFIGVYAPTEENFRLLREWQEEKEHAKPPQPKQRRKRRTKAQIAADNAAKLARSEPATE